jgi:hypothetical protein
MSLYFICPYILYLFRIQKGMFHELGFFLGGVGGTQPKTNKVHAGVKTNTACHLIRRIMSMQLEDDSLCSKGPLFLCCHALILTGFQLSNGIDHHHPSEGVANGWVGNTFPLGSTSLANHES